MDAVFPSEWFPGAFNRNANGGSPGCAMAFGRALREMKAYIDFSSGGRRVYLPANQTLDHRRKT